MKNNEKGSELRESEQEKLASPVVSNLLQSWVKSTVDVSGENGVTSYSRTAFLPLRCADHEVTAAAYFLKRESGWVFEVGGTPGVLPDVNVYSYATYYVTCDKCGRKYRVARDRLLAAAILELSNQRRKPTSRFGIALLAVAAR